MIIIIIIIKPMTPPSMPKNSVVVSPIRNTFLSEPDFLDIAKSPKIVH